MLRHSKTTILGLDQGKASVKAVCLEVEDGRVRLAKAAAFCPRNEGLLADDEHELLKSMAGWLQEQQLASLPVAAGLPQELTTPQICDFPPNVSAPDLQKLVDREISQLAGLIEEAFVSDYCRLPDASHSSVLIGVCRQSLVSEFTSRLEDMHLEVKDMTMNGLALADALLQLHPEAANYNRPQAILDLGSDTSTLVMLDGAKIVHIASLMFGTEKFARVYAHDHGCSLDEALDALPGCQPDWSAQDSVMLLAVRQLAAEIVSAQEQWQQEGDDADGLGMSGAMPFSYLWLCGGGASLAGLAGFLASSWDCETAVLGPVLPGATVPSPEYTTAFGLALHGSGAAAYRLPLLPPLLRWRQERMGNFPLLIAAYSILVLLLAGFFIWSNAYLARTQTKTETETAELKRCAELVPKLDSARATMLQYQKTLVPIIEAGSRSRVFLKTLDELQRARNDLPPEKQDWWCIYLADEFSYAASDFVAEAKRKAGETAEPVRRPPPPSGLFGAAATETAEADETDAAIPVLGMPFLSRLYVSGYVPSRKESRRYEDIKLISDHLNAGSLFANADWFNEWVEPPVARSWNGYLNAHQRQLGLFHSFVFTLPLEKRAITPPPATATPAARRRGRSDTPTKP